MCYTIPQALSGYRAMPIESQTNGRIATLLDRMNSRWTALAENKGVFQGSQRQPDILVIQQGGRPVVIENEYAPAAQVEAEALGRMGEHLDSEVAPASGRIDAVIALKSPVELRDCAGLDEVDSLLTGGIALEYALFRGQPPTTARFPERGFVTGSLRDLAAFVVHAAIPEEAVEEAVSILESSISDAGAILRQAAELSDDTKFEVVKLLKQEYGDQTLRMAAAIMQHENILGPLEVEEGTASWDRNPLLYYWTVFGNPGNAANEPWGWRVEGHHVSLHFSVWGDEVTAVTPFFLGANPAEVPKGPQKGLRILGGREDMAIELMSTLTPEQRAKAVIHDKAPWDIPMYNATRAAVHNGEGLAGAEMNGAQKELLLALVTEYVQQVRPEVAQERLEAIRKTGVDDFRIVWAGATDRSRDHYYRIHGGSFIVEFDNIQNGANHIHSVWRDVENDFAQDVLRDHRLMYHVL